MRLRSVSGWCHAVLAVALGCLPASCGGRSMGGWTYPPDYDGGLTRDGAVRRDGGRADGAVRRDGTVPADGGTSCETDDRWVLQATALSDVWLEGPMTPGGDVPLGLSVRLRASVSVTGCDALAGVQPEADASGRSLVLWAWVWRYQGTRDCPHESRVVPEVLALRDLTVGTWSVTDGLINTPTLTSFTVRDCWDGEDCQCLVHPPDILGDTGDPCSFDCQCGYPLGCVREGEVSPTGGGVCYHTCSTDADCPAPLSCRFGVLDVPEAVCAEAGRSCLETGCAPGFACRPSSTTVNAWTCHAEMDVSEVWQPCTEDCDCAAGLGCTQQSEEADSTCQIRCRGNRDCPDGWWCDELGSFYVNRLTCYSWWDD